MTLRRKSACLVYLPDLLCWRKAGSSVGVAIFCFVGLTKFAKRREVEGDRGEEGEAGDCLPEPLNLEGLNTLVVCLSMDAALRATACFRALFEATMTDVGEDLFQNGRYVGLYRDQ